MPVTTTYPGVYIEELPSSVRTITAVSTSVTAFVGTAVRGQLDTPVTLTSFADFERRFGALTSGYILGHAVQQFFLNGGSIAIVVRVAGANSAKATFEIPRGSQSKLIVTATEPGMFSDGLRVSIDYDTPTPDSTFNLRVSDLTGTVSETHRNLSMDSHDPRYVTTIVNSASSVLQVAVGGDDLERPQASGTVSEEITLPRDLAKTYNVVIGGDSREITLYDPAADGPTPPPDLTRLALLLERKLRSAAGSSSAPAGSRAFSRAQVHVFGKRLQTVSGEPGTTVLFDEQADAQPLNLQATANPTAYALTGGATGAPVTGQDFIGTGDKKGINALRDVTDVNLLCLPEVAALGAGVAGTVLAEAVALCQEKRMLLLVDPPAGWTSLDAARGGLADIDPIRSSYAALYFPNIQSTDPLTGQLQTYPPSGAVAGIMARTDGERGVWKAPAGTEATLTGVRALTVPLTDPENGLLNPLGINCLRSFPIVGPVVWGARTLEGADVLASQWKYVPVRRTALMIEESLYRGTKWVVFEPNDERLWGQIRLNVGAFLQTLFRQGAFQGTSAREAYFVKVDKDTTTQDDINRGVVNILVGFAPLKPAEFVVIQIAQIAGQIGV
jgi:phage tail sheath protein FI